jgi:hypothetical protein
LRSCVTNVDYMDNGSGKHQSNTVYDIESCAPCINAASAKCPTTILDTSMSGLENGKVRTYTDVAPSITAREYKEPRMVLSDRKDGKIN